jgi:hypothetical protein
MALSDYIPNVFGQAAPSYLQGLLGAEETQNLQNRANVQGLLGAGLALAQGMSRTGPRRSAAENILGALAGGFGAAGGAYEQGVKNYVTQQQIAQTQLAQTQAATKLRSIAEAKAKYPDLAQLFDIDSGEAVKQVINRERAKMYGFGGEATQVPTQVSAQMPTQVAQTELPSALSVTSKGMKFVGVPNFAAGEKYVDDNLNQQVQQSLQLKQAPAQTNQLIDPAALAKANENRRKAAFAYSMGDDKMGKFFTDEADRLDPKETFMFRDGKMVSTKRGLVGDFGGVKQLSPEEAKARGLDPTRGIWMLKGDGTPQLIEGTKPNARLLTANEIAQYNLPTDRGQVYQVDSNGKIDLVQGSMVDREKFTGEYANLALTEFGTADVSKLNPSQRKALDKLAESRGISRAREGAPKVYTGTLSKTTASDVEKGVITTADAVTRLNNIQFSYRPEYQNIGFRTKQAWGTLKDKFGGLSPAEKTQLTNYSQYRQNSLQNLNQTIKDITGAAMGVQEAERIIATLPNAGAGIFDGDSPTEFESKLNNGISQTKYALARKNYALRKGLNWESTPLDKMPSIINERGAAIAKQYNLDPRKAADLQTINRQLAAEFGVSF